MRPQLIQFAILSSFIDYRWKCLSIDIMRIHIDATYDMTYTLTCHLLLFSSYERCWVVSLDTDYMNNSHVVRIEIPSFELEGGSSCSFDKLRIYCHHCKQKAQLSSMCMKYFTCSQKNARTVQVITLYCFILKQGRRQDLFQWARWVFLDFQGVTCRTDFWAFV